MIRKPLLLLSLSLLLAISAKLTAKNNSDYVNLFIGTSGDNGQVDPGAGVPFGMVRVCPDTEPRQHPGYDYSAEKIRGISINRLSGVGCSGAGGNLLIKPAPFDQEVKIRKSTEKAFPGYYETGFDNGVTARLTATNNVAVEEYTFTQGDKSVLSINFSSAFENFREENHSFISDTEIEGFVRAANVCGHGRYKLFFHIKTSQPFTVESDKDHKAQLVFPQGKSKPVEVRIAISSVDQATAKEENVLAGKQSAAAIRAEAAKQWEAKLARITVEGDENEKTIFYTSLYRVYLSPANVTSCDNKYLGTDGKIHVAEGFTYYSSWSLWDSFRTKFPLIVLTEPKIMRDISCSLIKLYETGKEDWSTRNEATPTVRTEHAVILLLDAYRKGITDIDFKDGYFGMLEEAERLPMKSPDQKLESSYDLWALAQIADIVGKEEDAKNIREKSETLFEETWKKDFMNVDSTYGQMRGNGLYQGTRWQYRWAAPQYIDKMIEYVGSQETLRKQLETFFAETHYNQGNEPDIHVPFLFNRFGAPEKTQDIVRRLLTDDTMIHRYGGNAEFPKPYVGRAFKNGPEGFMPEMDEDDGTMGAWYVFSSMGFYPMIVGSPEYEIVSPIFDKVTIHLENGKTFKILTKNRKNINDPIKSITLNGQAYTKYQLRHAAIENGGTLELCY